LILYVNGDSHTAAAEAVNVHTFAEDDPEYFYMGRAPHPDNLAVSWGKLLSLALRTGLKCDAEGASSNARIIRTTKEWLANSPTRGDMLVIIQWSTWEREEWYDDLSQQYFQVNASGIDHVPQAWQERYRQYIMGIDWNQKTEEAHNQIWTFHKELESQGIKHIFFNGNNDFSKIKDQRAWAMCYIAPYDPTMTFDAIVRKQGIETVAPNSYHFGKDAHSFFHRFILNYIMMNKFI
jgi:hypothetical protein